MNKMLFRLVISQFKLFFREPGVVFWSFGFPVLMAWILGIAFANKGEIERNIAVVAENQEEVYLVPEWLLNKTGTTSTKYSRESGLEWKVGENHGEQAHFRFLVMSEDAAILALKRGQIALWIEGSPERDLRFRFDPNNTDARLTYLLLESSFRKQKSLNRKTEVLPLTTIGIRYVDFLIPGLMAIFHHECMFVGNRLEFN